MFGSVPEADIQHEAFHNCGASVHEGSANMMGGWSRFLAQKRMRHTRYPVRSALSKRRGSKIQGLASKALDVVDELVRGGASRIDVASGDRFADVGVEIGGQWQISRLLVVLVPETS
jgi:hypothetical protein